MERIARWTTIAIVAGCLVACSDPQVRDGGSQIEPTTGASSGSSDDHAGSSTSTPPPSGERPPRTQPPDLGSETGDLPFPPPTPEIPGDAPVVRSLAPVSGPAEGGTLVVVRGEHFTSDVDVYLGGVVQPAVDVIDDLELWFMTEPGEAGLASLRVENEAGVFTLPDAYRYEAALRLDSLEPARGPSSGGTTVQVHGAGFGPDTRVFFGDREAREVTALSSRVLEVVTPPGAPGRAVTVRAVDTRLASRAGAFTWEEAPRVRAVLPAEGSVAGGEALRVFGEGLGPDCTLRFRNLGAPLVEDGRGGFLITSPGGAPGLAEVRWDCGARGSGVLAEPFTFAEEVVGSLSVHPEAGLAAGGDLVAVVVPQEVSGSDVRVWFGADEATVVDGSGRVVLVMSPGGSPGTVEVEVEGQPGAAPFEYVPNPSFDGLSPGHVTTAGGTMTLSGTGLDGVDSVVLESREIVPIERTGEALTFAVPPGSEGSASLAVRVGWLVLPTGLRVEWRDGIAFDSFAPASGPSGGGTRVTVIGRGFGPGCTVRVGGEPLETVRVGTGLLEATTPGGPVGPVDVAVSGCGEGSWVFEEPYRYVSAAIASGGAGGGVIDGEVTVTVREFGTFFPVEGATVQVGVRSTTPWVATTGPAGEVTFQDPELRGPQTVTAFAPDRGVESIVDTNARRVTLMLAQLPPEPCDPNDPDCDDSPPPPRPPPPPPGFVQGYLTGMEKQEVLPDGAIPRAYLETTREFQGFRNPEVAPGSNVLSENGPFGFTARLGDFALIARCGYLLDGVFHARRLGVVRGLSQRPGDPPAEAQIDCNIPLDRGFDLQLPNAPTVVPGAFFPGRIEASIVFDFSSEGVLEGFDNYRGITQPMRIAGLPPLAGPLAGVLYTVTAGVYPTQGTLPGTNSWARNMRRYPQVLRMPPLLPLPRFLVPGPAQPFSDGYIEWEIDDDLDPPDFWLLTVTANNFGFDRWTVFVPGDYRSFHLNDFPTWAGFAGPELPVGSLQVLVRAIRTEADFSIDDFSRTVTGQGRWEATSIEYENLMLRAPGTTTP